MESKITREQFKGTLTTLARQSEPIIVEEGLRVWDKMTVDERDRFATDPSQGGAFSPVFPWRIAKTIFCATGPEKLEREWSCEALLKAIRAVRRIDKSRP